MTYKEYKNSEQEAFNSLPIFFAFSNKQFKEQMEKRGLKETDTDKIYSLPGGAGGYYLRKDAQIIRDFMNREDKLQTLMKDHDFAVSAFYYEMANHEYHINRQGDWDVCNCFGNCEYGYGKDYHDYLKEMGYDEQMNACFREAKSKFLKACKKNDWY